MFRILVVLCCALSLNAQLAPEEQHPAPEPYSFAYSSPNEDGSSSSREETGDANGRVTGSYTLLGADGQNRLVEYVADENGFRANVITNEIGTESQNSADVQYQSSAPTAAELNAQWEASGAGRARLSAPGLIGGQGGQIIRAQAPLISTFARGNQGQAIRAQPINLGAGLVRSPVAPIGGGFAGAQTLRTNQGIRVANPVQSQLSRPLSRIPLRPAAPVFAPTPIARPISVPIAPIQAQAPQFQTQAGFTRAQPIGFSSPLGGGLVGAGGVTPFGVRLAPNGLNNLNLGQFGVGLAPSGVNTASIQQLDSLRGFQGPLPNIRGLNLGNIPLNNGGNFLLLPNNLGPQQNHLVSESDASNEAIVQTKDIKEEDYGRKSK